MTINPITTLLSFDSSPSTYFIYKTYLRKDKEKKAEKKKQTNFLKFFKKKF